MVGATAAVVELLRLGADAFQTSATTRSTPMHSAASSGWPDALEQLIEGIRERDGPDALARIWAARDRDERSVADVARAEKQAKCLEVLHSAGDPNAAPPTCLPRRKGRGECILS
mmetsp:Transcript_45528/g.142592  ORF Transcript_45528/g.142592 Transcript_45528/m.142592 type:complete len:115 (-) Transcript_45528:1123-1467(-)